MTKKEKKADFSFLPESPVQNDRQDKFNHAKTADALVKILKSDSCPHTIGLFSKWGTGKTGVIKILKSRKSNFKIIEFDAWKYEEDTFRRQLIRQIASDLDCSPKELDEIEKKLTFSKQEDAPSKLYFDLAKFTRFILFLGFMALIYAVLAYFNLINAPWINLLFWLSSVGAATYFKFLEEIVPLKKATYARGRYELPEEFMGMFTKLVSSKLSKNNPRLIIVVDNLDRIEAQKARKILSALKTFLEIPEKEIKGFKVIFLVPCDYSAIKRSASENDEAEEVFADEFLRKIFNIHFWLPEFIEGDLAKETRRLLKMTNVKELQNQDKVETVINAAFRGNPRQIKQFINNLVANMVFAKGIPEVSEVISKNPAFLAKVLILKERFPDAYHSLKTYWYDQRKTIEVYGSASSEHIELSNFLADTDHISASNAEPFIYFKRSKIFSDFDKADELHLALIKGEVDVVKKVLTSCSGKNETACLNLIVETLKTHQTLEKAFNLIFQTQLHALQDVNFDLSRQSSYFKETSKYFCSSLGDRFIDLEPTLVLNLLVDKNPEKILADQVIEKYLLSLRDYSEKKHHKALLSITSELIKRRSLISKKDKEYASGFLIDLLKEPDFYKKLSKEDLEVQKEFVNLQGLDSVFQRLFKSNETIDDVSVLLGFKELIKAHKKTDYVWGSVNNLIQKISKKGNVDEKGFMELQVLLGCLEEFDFDSPEVNQNTKDTIIELFIRAYNLTNWEQKTDLIHFLLFLRELANTNHQHQMQSFLIDLFQHRPEVSQARLAEALDFYDKEVIQKLYDEFSSQLLKRIVVGSSNELAIFLFQNISEDQKNSIFTHLIQQRPDGGVDLIKILKEHRLIQNFDDVMHLLIDKFISQRQPEDLKGYIFQNLKITSSHKLKEKIAQGIIQHGTNGNNAIRQVARNLAFSGDKIISSPDKKEVNAKLYDFWESYFGKAINNDSATTLDVLLLWKTQLTKEQLNEILNQISANLQTGNESDQRALVSRDLLGRFDKISFDKNEAWLSELMQYLEAQRSASYKLFLSNILENLDFQERHKKAKEFVKKAASFKHETP